MLFLGTIRNVKFQTIVISGMYFHQFFNFLVNRKLCTNIIKAEKYRELQQKITCNKANETK